MGINGGDMGEEVDEDFEQDEETEAAAVPIKVKVLKERKVEEINNRGKNMKSSTFIYKEGK